MCLVFLWCAGAVRSCSPGCLLMFFSCASSGRAHQSTRSDRIPFVCPACSNPLESCAPLSLSLSLSLPVIRFRPVLLPHFSLYAPALIRSAVMLFRSSPPCRLEIDRPAVWSAAPVSRWAVSVLLLFFYVLGYIMAL